MVLLSSPLEARASTVVRPSEALEHLGESVVVEGQVDTVVCSPQACLLSFAPGFSGLVVAIPGDVVRSFPPPEATFESRRVRVRGIVADRGGRPRIEIRAPDAIELLEGAASQSTILSATADLSSGTSAPGATPAPPKADVQSEDGRKAKPRLSAREAAAALGVERGEPRANPLARMVCRWTQRRRSGCFVRRSPRWWNESATSRRASPRSMIACRRSRKPPTL